MVIKGAQKQMIVLRTGASRYFDEAYFVLRSGVNPGKGQRTDLLTEATRILEESESGRAAKQGRLSAWLWFFLGLSVGAAGALLTVACFQLL